MPYEFITGYTNGFDDVHFVDLRSDTISKPTQAMRDSMYTAQVGDSVYGEDPSVNELERRSAELVGKEDAVFVPSGTMANLLAIMVHCQKRGSEIICGNRGHTFRFEQGGPSFIAGVSQNCLTNLDDGTFDLKEMQERIRSIGDIHEPITSLIIIENTHNMCGGRVLPLEWIDELATIAKRHNLPVHMDGARLMNAAVASKTPPARICRDVDSVCFCLSKGLAAPVGSVLAGSQQFCTLARRYRKALGGGMRQCGFLAAAGIVAIQNLERLQLDHDKTMRIAKAINNMNSDLVRVDLKSVQTNILMVHVDERRVNAQEFLQRLADVKETDTYRVSIKAASRDAGCCRFVMYWEITDEDVEMVIRKLELTILEFHARSKLVQIIDQQ
ncbi:uncharacterized protein [Atheta coriaria]|uniref:uncharacterized protein n=1 Tax=Dalotia coriaria TaxID=877792 RepID=UPI0031F3F88A